MKRLRLVKRGAMNFMTYHKRVWNHNIANGLFQRIKWGQNSQKLTNEIQILVLITVNDCQMLLDENYDGAGI